jgi:hypothetical protein
MKDPEKWKELCALAAVEQDPTKLIELTKEIIRLLEEKEQRLNALRKRETGGE